MPPFRNRVEVEGAKRRQGKIVCRRRQTLPAVLVSTLNSPLRTQPGFNVTSVDLIAAPCRSPSHATATSFRPGERGEL